MSVCGGCLVAAVLPLDHIDRFNDMKTKAMLEHLNSFPFPFPLTTYVKTTNGMLNRNPVRATMMLITILKSSWLSLLSLLLLCCLGSQFVKRLWDLCVTISLLSCLEKIVTATQAVTHTACCCSLRGKMLLTHTLENIREK